MDGEVKVLINLWQNERCQWDVSDSTYANKDTTIVVKKDC